MTKKKKIILISVASVLAIALIVAIIFIAKDHNTVKKSSGEKHPDNITETVSLIETSDNDSAVTAENIKAKPGDTVKVPVRINKNPGIMASQFKIIYNDDKLTYLNYEKGEVFENYHFAQNDNTITFINIENGDVKKNGVIFYLNFKVNDNAVLGDTEIKIETTDQSFVNYNEEFVKIPGGNSIVTIEK